MSGRKKGKDGRPFGISTAIAAIAVLIVWFASLALAQPAPTTAPDRGVATGTVADITGDYILVQTPEARLRYWFKWVDVPGLKPDADIRSSVAKLSVGDYVAVRWTSGDRTRLESVAPTTRPIVEVAKPQEPAVAVVVQPLVDSTPTTQPASAEAPTNSTGEAVNAMIDNLNAFASRLLELPVFILLAIVALIGGVLLIVFGQLSNKPASAAIVGRVRMATWAIVLFAIIFVIDRKIAHLQDAVTSVRTKMTADAGTKVTAADAVRDSQRQTFLFDPIEANRSLAKQFGEVNVRPLIYDEATDIVQVHLNSPLDQVYLAVIDLRNPSVEVHLGYTADHKTLTSQFARDNNCTVAINGEAGMSPAPNSGLGVWRGNMVQAGKLVSSEDPKILRPFLSFDRRDRATFTPAVSPQRALGADPYNIIWGRLDGIVNGVVQAGSTGDRQPRTAMAINQAGTILYLMVVDGRQPRYSTGFTRAEVGQFLKAFGAYDGMLCDEGGSSCMYLKQFGGISNIPSDNQGQERPTYSHFGISIRANPRIAASE